MPSRICQDCGTIYNRSTAPGQRCPNCQTTHQQTTEQTRATQRGTTKQRGYNASHTRLRKQLLAAWQPGQPCAHCQQPMWNKTGLDLAHTTDRTSYRGLAHAECNRGNR